MKKHPVDDLFKEKLSIIERQPSAEAWNRIRIPANKRERRLGGWIWYAAASVTLALMAGYSVWHHEATPVPEIAAVEKKQSTTLPQPLAEVVREGRTNPILVSEAGKPVRRTDTQIEPAIITPEYKKEEQMLTSVEEAVPAQVVNKQLAIPEIKGPDPEILSQNVAMTTPEAALPEFKNVDRTIIVNVTSEEDSLDQPKASRFTRVFRQLKNARAGERVNWDEVGFNPRSVLARVDGKRKL